jgi:sarcosine oxidase delta subunit
METTTNKFGFPIQTCRRCEGTGHYSFNARMGTVCFNCLGKKTTVAPYAKKAFTAFQTYVHDRKKVAAQNLEVGDLIAHNNVWCKVVNVNVTDEVLGRTMAGGEVTSTYFRVLLTVTYKDVEETFKINGGAVMRRHSGKIDAEPFLAMIKQPKEKK